MGRRRGVREGSGRDPRDEGDEGLDEERRRDDRAHVVREVDRVLELVAERVVHHRQVHRLELRLRPRRHRLPRLVDRRAERRAHLRRHRRPAEEPGRLLERVEGHPASAKSINSLRQLARPDRFELLEYKIPAATLVNRSWADLGLGEVGRLLIRSL